MRPLRFGSVPNLANEVFNCCVCSSFSTTLWPALKIAPSFQECSEQREGETRTEAAERRILAISSIQALALDYDVGDHGILKESILLEVMATLVRQKEESPFFTSRKLVSVLFEMNHLTIAIAREALDKLAR